MASGKDTPCGFEQGLAVTFRQVFEAVNQIQPGDAAADTDWSDRGAGGVQYGQLHVVERVDNPLLDELCRLVDLQKKRPQEVKSIGCLRKINFRP